MCLCAYSVCAKTRRGNVCVCVRLFLLQIVNSANGAECVCE